MKKLVEIQTGKRSQIPRSQSQTHLVHDYRAKSLHISKRKIELERIERENQKIAQKIYELKPMVLVSDLEQEFTQHKRYSQSIRKLFKKKQPAHGGKPGKLAPINDRSVSEDNG